MGSQVDPQGIGGSPGNGFPQVGGSHGEDLGEQGDRCKSCCCQEEGLLRTALYGCINEITENLGIDDLQGNAAQKGDRQSNHSPLLRLQILCEERSIGLKGNGHGTAALP